MKDYFLNIRLMGFFKKNLGAIHIPRGQFMEGGGWVWQNSTLVHEGDRGGIGLESAWTHVPLNLRKIY